MTAISSYYANVGVRIDKSSLSQVSRYLRSVENQVRRFQANITKNSQINLKLNLNNKALLGNIRSLFNKSSSTFKINATLSPQSLNHMRAQIRSAISGITVSPRIRPNVVAPRSQPGSSGGRQTGPSRNPTSRPTSPFHNPMMVGGGVGAFMRYGAFSLPFVAGSFGLNALSNRAAVLQNQDMMMDVSIGALGSAGESERYKKFLNDLGDRLGRTTESMTPFFSQMLSGAKGTELEPHLQEGFASLMEFGSVMGLGTESMKGTIKAFTQMIL